MAASACSSSVLSWSTAAQDLCWSSRVRSTSCNKTACFCRSASHSALVSTAAASASTAACSMRSWRAWAWSSSVIRTCRSSAASVSRSRSCSVQACKHTSSPASDPVCSLSHDRVAPQSSSASTSASSTSAASHTASCQATTTAAATSSRWPRHGPRSPSAGASAAAAARRAASAAWNSGVEGTGPSHMRSRGSIDAARNSATSISCRRR
mmetsp:Transcript_86804/g.232661  ORF Transcript_86804/g.232661 Transcript_86804/m.232661 type:complete len:210 (-) Transcript_86804:163-792(-)